MMEKTLRSVPPVQVIRPSRATVSVEIPTVINWNGNDYTVIQMPYAQTGGGTAYLVVSGTVSSVDSDKMNSLTINGVDYTDQYSTVMPEPVDGKKYFIIYDGKNPQSSFNIEGTNDWSQPSMAVSPTTLTGFTTDPDTPSPEQSFTVSGQDLTANISLSAPASYEISATSGSGFGSSLTLTRSGGTVNSTTIYVRLRSGLSAGSYDGEDITISTAGASDKTVTCSGVVEVPDPSMTVSPTSLTGFTAEPDTTSLEQSFTVSGQYLTDDITLTPPAHYEISVTSGSGFGSSLTLTPSGGTVSSIDHLCSIESPVYLSGSYDGEDITISTASTSDQTVTCSGDVIEESKSKHDRQPHIAFRI
ncbi:MAG: hypothetical protein U5N56_01900 [Candidatus Marinimicrobia bacterium]|nr:hypothetical protein [Candidatus Neomarinimicrobiota bacterium]